MKRRDLLALFVTVLSACALAAPGAYAQSRYPDRPIRLVIPFPPGGSFDAVGRSWAERMKGALGTVVVENQGGGGSSLGAAAVARAARRLHDPAGRRRCSRDQPGRRQQAAL